MLSCQDDEIKPSLCKEFSNLYIIGDSQPPFDSIFTLSVVDSLNIVTSFVWISPIGDTISRKNNIVKMASMEDDGIFKCIVLYSDTNCPKRILEFPLHPLPMKYNTPDCILSKNVFYFKWGSYSSTVLAVDIADYNYNILCLINTNENINLDFSKKPTQSGDYIISKDFDNIIDKNVVRIQYSRGSIKSWPIEDGIMHIFIDSNKTEYVFCNLNFYLFDTISGKIVVDK
jgi:hypothetical protein